MTKKTSINIPICLANAYGNSGTQMKTAIREIKVSSMSEKALKVLYKKWRVQNGEELFCLLFPNIIERKTTRTIKLHMPDNGMRENISHLSGEAELSAGFRKLLLIHYATNAITNTINQGITNYYNVIVSSAHKPASISGASCPDTGITVKGNKKWFLVEYRKILKELPGVTNTFIEPFMGSGVVTLDTLFQNRFKRIITNDNYKHKTNYIKALFQNPEKLKSECLSLKPDDRTYHNACTQIDANTFHAPIDHKVAALYHLKNHCENYLGTLKQNKLTENNPNATENYRKNLDFFCNIPILAKKIKIFNEDALDIIKKNSRKKNFLFVDPPYPETSDYEQKSDPKQFEEIAKATIAFNGYFLFCCRITGKHQNIHSHTNTYTKKDLCIKNIIDKLFYGHKLFYLDYLFSRNGVAIERVITNFPFSGCRFYDSEQPWCKKDDSI